MTNVNLQRTPHGKARILLLILAACLCLTACSGQQNAIEDSVAVATGFELKGAYYFPIGFEERKLFGLLDESETGLNAENTYKITEKDLGEKMGSVELPADTGTVIVDVYHFASLPEYDAICIAGLPDGYAFYVAGGLSLTQEQMAVSDGILEAYGMPESILELEVRDAGGSVLHTVTDKAQIEAFCTLLSGKTNIGLLEKEKLAAKLWYDTYGNEDVYFDEAEGYIKFNAESTDDLYDTAHQLWSAGERDVYISTGQGFRIFMIFQPSMNAVVMYDSHYILSDAEAAELAQLLG